MKRSSYFFWSLMCVCLFPVQADAQTCAPRDFTIADIEKLDFSDIVKYSGYSTLDQSSSSNSNRKIDGSAIVEGVPVQMSYADAKSASEHILNKSGYEFSRDTRIAYVRSALSATGAEMYSNCLGTQNIKVEIPTTAYSEQSFFANITWRPQYAGPNESEMRIRLIGGTIDGAADTTLRAERFQDKSVQIDRGNNRVQISISIDGRTHPTVFIPPIPQLRKFKLVRRTGVGSGANSDGDRCTDHAYLVDELGSRAGNNLKSCDLCVNSTTDGILLPSTAQISPLPAPHGTRVFFAQGNSQLRACGSFRTNGAGRGSGRFEIGHGEFVIWELVPN